MSKRRLAQWNGTKDYWAVDEDIFDESEAYSDTFPTSGTAENGILYELPRWNPTSSEPETPANEILPTPVCSDWKYSSIADMNRNSPQLRAVSTILSESTKEELLGTPRCSAGMRAELRLPDTIKDGDARARLEDQIALLPTTRSALGHWNNQLIYERPLNKPQNLENALARVPSISEDLKIAEAARSK